MVIKICLAKQKDRAQLLKIFSDYKGLAGTRIDCYLKHNSTIVAKDKNKIIGATQWHVKENPNAGLAELEEVWVQKEYRNKGIGKKLILFTLETAKKYFRKNKFRLRKVFVFTDSQNLPASKLYERCGFKFRANVGDIFEKGKNELMYVGDVA